MVLQILVLGVSRPTAREAPTRNMQNIKDKHADQLLKTLQHPTISICFSFVLFL